MTMAKNDFNDGTGTETNQHRITTAPAVALRNTNYIVLNGRHCNHAQNPMDIILGK
jgi:hypothetical protein